MSDIQLIQWYLVSIFDLKLEKLSDGLFRKTFDIIQELSVGVNG